MVNKLRLFRPTLILSGLALAIVSVIGYGLVVRPTADAADCDNNAVIRCGYNTPTDLANRTQGSGELQALYNNPYVSGYGIGDLSYFKTHAEYARVYKDGRIVLANGKQVASNGASLGRQTGNGNNYSLNVGGHRYYWGYNQTAFAGSVLGAYVLMNADDHSMQFAALTACGNPAWGSSPGYKCTMLNKEQVDRDTFKFSTNYFVKNGATVQKVVYEFGDGTSEVRTNPAEQVTHTYAPGNYTAKVTVYFNVFGRTETDTRVECTKPVEVKPAPVYSCDALQKIVVDRDTFKFSTNYTAKNGASVVKAIYDFGDGTTATKTNPSDLVEHTYQPGDYTAKTTMYFNVEGQQKTSTGPQCTQQIKVESPPVYSCNALQKDIISRNNFSFTTSYTAQNGAVLTKIVYDFGDGNSKSVTSNFGQSVTHTYAPGNFTARSTIFVTVNGQEKSHTQPACTQQIHVVAPVYSCDALNKIYVDRDTFKFNTDYTAQNGATVKKVVYDFGDGHNETRNNPSDLVEHTYQPGDYTAKATVYFLVDGQERADTGPSCTQPIKVEQEHVPVYACNSLDATLIQGNRNYRFTATAFFKDAKPVSASFDFGDGQKVGNLTNFVTTSPTTATISTEHAYAPTLSGKQTIVAELTFNIGSAQKSVKCQAIVELPPQTCADHPNTPECQPPKTCQTNPEMPQCQPQTPPRLPSTGPEEVVSTILGLGSITGAGAYYRSSRRNVKLNLLNKR